ncbi:3-isopropylmalate dehydrogenase [Porphyridium purpureum]|uniref:3-isopropylmalate dehydrogenase n=1 Tax=Porphyridium purpureum TaxID=35688 RepID=A0A5J4YS11_PORPP|nr:3-isopropylmalate dehydrogenase [Porphyridium purpureum]|eukprot:POR4412..scf236_6
MSAFVPTVPCDVRGNLLTCRSRAAPQRARSAATSRSSACVVTMSDIKGSSDKPYKIAVLPGDGAGPVVTDAAVKVLKAVSKYTDIKFEFTEGLYGEKALEQTGSLVPEDTIALCRGSDAVLRGYQGKSRFTPEHAQGNLSAHTILKEKLGLFVQLRPVKVFDPLVSSSPIREDLVRGTDIMIVREVSGGALPYTDTSLVNAEEAKSQFSYTRQQVSNIADVALEIAERRSGRVLNVDKADSMNVSRFWRTALHEEFKKKLGSDRRDILLEDMFVDDFCRELVLHPARFDLIVTSNLFGDILSEVASGISGGMRLSPSAWLSGSGPGVYGPADLFNLSAYPRGSQEMPVEGKIFSNPIASIRAASMMLRYSLEEPAAADLIQIALTRVLKEVIPADAPKSIKYIRKVSCDEFADEMADAFELLRNTDLMCDPEVCGE